MVRSATLVLFLLSGGCATPGQQPPVPRYSLAGGWAFADKITESYHYDSADCATDFGARYNADGTYIGYEEEGRWSVTGDVLTETVERELDETGEMSSVPARESTIRLRWLSPNHIITDVDGANGLIRCPPLP